LRRWLHRQDRVTRFLAVAVVALSILVFALIFPRLNAGRRDQRDARGTSPVERGLPAAVPRTPGVSVPPTRSRRAPTPAEQPKSPVALRTPRSGADRSTSPRAAIVIDDLGQNLSHLEQLADLDIPLSIAVIPGLPASTRTVSEAARRGIEMLLHQPMEPRAEGGKNPGPGVLLTSMTAEALRARLRANLAAVPGAVGVNNHMGSLFTEDIAGLGAVMAEIKEHNLFWLDSRTTAATRGVDLARSVGVPAIERDVFLDTEVNVAFIRNQVRELIEIARSHGTAVGIGHPHPETIAVLRELRSELLASGVSLVPVSWLVRGSPAAERAAATVRKKGENVAASSPGNTTP